MAARRRQQNAHAANGKHSNNNTTTKYAKSRQKGSKEDNDSSASKSKGVNFGYAALVAGLAALCGYLHRNHVATMFENDRHFSHLSTLERELAFRTEMGLYYSYYKTIIEAPSFFTGLNEVMYDNITEYPDTINTLKRFNLYPEVVLGIGYRWYEGVMSGMNIPTKQCWEVNRGEGLSPVQSCEGLGEPSYFYVEGVFLLNGIMMAVFFLFGTYLSGSIAGGILAVLSFFYNHGECTRVQWTPPLRESHAFPFLVIELFIVTWTLRTPKPGMKHSLLIALSVISFMLPWQFAQFALMTQTVAVFGTYVLQYIDAHRVKVILIGQGLGLAVSYIFLFGNEMLLSSFFASCILAVFVVVLLEPVTELLKFRILIWAVQGVIWLVGTVGIKTVVAKVLRIADDAHIWDIFRSKFSNFKNFHTMLYTCAAEFDFMEAETPGRVLKTLLLPMCLVSVGGVLYHILKQEHKLWTTPADEEEEDSDASSEPEEGSTEQPVRKHAELLYHVFQLIAYSLMAIIIMRLKLFWTPHMCLMTSLLASQQLFGRLIKSKQLHMTLVGLLIGLMSIQGYFNLQHQWSIRGEFSNPPTEELVEWIKAATPQNAVFAGPMPTMATVKLCTLRPIVNHPHYEDAGLRARTKKVYSMYSRKPMAVVHQNMQDLQANYVILEDSWCRRRSAKGCGMAEIWDLEDVEYRDEKTPTCFKLQKNPGPYFKRVFQNSAYHVLQVLNGDS